MRVSNILLRTIMIPCALWTQACTKSSGPSASEQMVLAQKAFTQLSDVHDRVDGVNSGLDSLPATNPYYATNITEAIEVPLRDCTVPGLYEAEKQMALSEAKADPSGNTIPVKFSYSFGRMHDVMAKYANERAVLSQTTPGISYIPVGGRTTATYNGKHFYYVADNSKAAEDYKTGKRCFFGTIKLIDSAGPTSSKYDFITVTNADLPYADLPPQFKTDEQKINQLIHRIHYMYYGYCVLGRCSSENAFAGEYANRLFKEVPSLDDDGNPQIIKLYMADFRSEQMKHDIIRLSEDTTRGEEIDTSIDNILNTCEIHKNYYSVTKNLSTEAVVNIYSFPPIRGSVQLLHNILSHDVDGTMLSTQYTPIVLDLGNSGVKTSSQRWGTYFNMAAHTGTAGQTYDELAHRTAWIGGDYADYNSGANYDNRVNVDVRLKANDGFLVIPNADGSVTSSKNLFGDKTVVNGTTYENGFKALEALAGKDCSDKSDPKSIYVGPWDTDLYENKLKIWVDEDRDGRNDDGELKTLRELGILAINVCNIVHAEEQDAFGNGTSLRSAFLMNMPGENLVDQEAEILHRLYTGYGLEGEPTNFRLAIDLLFQADPDKRCKQSN